MRKILLAIALATTSVSLTACSFDQAPVVSTRATLIDEKALIAAELAWNTAAKTYIEMVENDQLTGDKRAATRNGLNKAYDLLVIVRKTRAITDLNAFNSLVGGLFK